MRYKLIQDYQKGEENEMSPEETKKIDAKLQLIDTTLLKCYIKVSSINFDTIIMHDCIFFRLATTL